MLKKLVLVLAGCTLAACNNHSNQAELCELGLKRQLKSPSSYRRVKLTDVHKPNVSTQVYITYDASNSYGAQIRGEIVCAFTGPDKKPKLQSVYLNGKYLSESAKDLFLLSAEVDQLSRK